MAKTCKVYLHDVDVKIWQSARKRAIDDKVTMPRLVERALISYLTRIDNVLPNDYLKKHREE